MLPETSILIPAYNCGDYLLECIGSILRQKYKDYEILLIDDGSTDETDDLIKRLNHPKIRYYKNERNQGIVKTLNSGLDLAKGKYIARMDADDLMLGNRLQEQIDFLNRNPDYGMVGGDYHLIDESGNYRRTITTSKDYNFIKLGIIFRNQFHHATVTMRTDLARELRYAEEFPYCEDHELWVRMSKVTKVTNLHSTYLAYRWHSNNSCNQNQNTLKSSVLSLLSRELEALNIEHSAEELMLQGAVCFGKGEKMFRDDARLENLSAWYDRIFSAEAIVQNYQKQWLDDFRKYILKDYSNVEEKKNRVTVGQFKYSIEPYDISTSADEGISVIMPTFNQASFIKAAFLSLNGQTFRNWELIIINDGSTDRTEEMILPFINDPKVKYVKNAVNRGLGASLNQGIEMASFNFIAYLPSDDLFYKDHLCTLYENLVKNKALMAVSGILYEHHENIESSSGKHSLGRIKDYPLQLVQVMHRKTEDIWLERPEITTSDLDEMFWNKLLIKDKVVYTKTVSCEWVNHPKQRHKLIQEFSGGGIYSYKQHYDVKEPIYFKGSGNIIDEKKYFSDLSYVNVKNDDEPLKILLVGELSLNPERIIALEARGHKLYGLWMPNASGFLNSVGPFPFGKITQLSLDNYKDEILMIQPDIIYGLLNYIAIPLVYEVFQNFRDTPFVWHFKESPTYCKQRGLWDRLITLYRESDGQIFLSQEVKDWFGQFIDLNDSCSILLDGDLPSKSFFKSKTSPLLSDEDGAIHTVLVGRPYGLVPEHIGQLARHNIHFHFYGNFHQKLWESWVNHARALAPFHFHIHNQCNPSDWTEELSKYDAGWMHVFKADNERDIARVTWNQLNHPARMPTLAAAGLPMIHYDDQGHISATYNLLRKLNIGLFFTSIDDLSEKLNDKNKLDRLRENCWKNRMHFTFDEHCKDLIAFFRKVIEAKRKIKM